MYKLVKKILLLENIKMMALLIALPTFLWLSCKSNANYNGDHLPPKVMQKVLMDISLAEAYSAVVKDSLHKGGSKNIDSLTVYYKDIFAHYHITEDQFKESLDWYKSHPAEMDTMYSNLMPVIAKLQAIMPVPAIKIPAPDNNRPMGLPTGR
jgi:hypothetical protein